MNFGVSLGAQIRRHWVSAGDYFDRWYDDGTLERMHHALYVKCRERDEPAASPTAAVIERQGVKSAEKWGA